MCGAGRGANLRERLLEAPTPGEALGVMEDALLGQLTGRPVPDPAVTAAACACPGVFRSAR